ncbi:MAG: helix-turn-helix domain-containing protein [Ruminococcus sp.]|nr:helix-turn-helix domain-containing protein [Ruminococcus sp.]MDE6848763.1 helix-turn-helix domain-containing protein [Ruminococcus sp.]MDE7138362.1 helix-turn-helix domain-containing protein [Ruminococcus sp.]
MNIGKSIRRIRTESNMSQEEFAKIFFVTRQTVSNWECEKSYPDLNTIVKISDRFGISLDTLLKEDKEMVNDISEKTTLGLKWNKIRQTVFIVISIIIMCAVVSLSVYGIIWHGRKNKLENHFNDSISLLGFSETDERYYVMENNNTSYILPHQEMPSFWDFSTDFHAKHLDCSYETDLCVINVRISEDMYSLTITDKESGEDYYVDIGEKGSLLPVENLPEFAEKQYCDNKDTIKSILEKGTGIYNKVYMD